MNGSADKNEINYFINNKSKEKDILNSLSNDLNLKFDINRSNEVESPTDSGYANDYDTKTTVSEVDTWKLRAENYVTIINKYSQTGSQFNFNFKLVEM
jgi:hypothetical protein